MNSYKAPIAIHPGETLKEILKTYDMSQAQLASCTGLHSVTIDNILSGKESISPEIALSLSLVFDMSAGFWNNLQKNYEDTKNIEHWKSILKQKGRKYQIYSKNDFLE